MGVIQARSFNIHVIVTVQGIAKFNSTLVKLGFPFSNLLEFPIQYGSHIELENNLLSYK